MVRVGAQLMDKLAARAGKIRNMVLRGQPRQEKKVLIFFEQLEKKKIFLFCVVKRLFFVCEISLLL